MLLVILNISTALGLRPVCSRSYTLRSPTFWSSLLNIFKFPSGTREQRGWQSYLGRVSGQTSLWTLVLISPLWGILWYLLLVHFAGSTSCPKELQDSYLWDHSGAPDLALIPREWPAKQLFPRIAQTVFVEILWDWATSADTDFYNSHVGDTSLGFWGIHGPLLTSGLPHVGSICRLSLLHVPIYIVASGLQHRRAANVALYILYPAYLPK